MTAPRKDLELPGALRWLRRRARLVHAGLVAAIGLLPHLDRPAHTADMVVGPTAGRSRGRAGAAAAAAFRNGQPRALLSNSTRVYSRIARHDSA